MRASFRLALGVLEANEEANDVDLLQSAIGHCAPLPDWARRMSSATANDGRGLFAISPCVIDATPAPLPCRRKPHFYLENLQFGLGAVC